MLPQSLLCFVIIAFVNLFQQLLASPFGERPPLVNRTSNPIVFPSEDGISYVGGRRPLAPTVDDSGEPLCKQTEKDTYCESVSEYPESIIREIVRYSVSDFEKLFGKPPSEDSVKPRDSDKLEDSLGETLCGHKSETFRPKAASNEKMNWAFIVNDNEYVQAVTAEKCEEADLPCKFVDSSFSPNMETKCKQRYAFKRLLAIHPNKKEAYTDSFRFPSCCVCHVTYPNFLTRTRDQKLIRLVPPQTSPGCAQQPGK